MKWIANRFSGYLIRISPEIKEYGDDYLWCIPLSDEGELTGFSSKPPTPTLLKTAIQAAITLGFQNPVINRRGLHPRTLTTDDTKQGVLVMQKHKHAHMEDKHNTDGSLDDSVVKANVAAYNDAVQSGKVKILAIGDPVPVPGLPGVVAKLVVMKE